jgi:CRISPR-associated protein (TIGR02710 family)
MSDVLIVTLGTSPEPIINCITSLRPERVVFLCSTETEKLVNQVLEKVPIVDFQSDRDVVVLQQRRSAKEGDEVINELDQLDRVYRRTLDLFVTIRVQLPGCVITADYTGGTKTMTTGLAMAAIDDGKVRLNITTSNRVQEQSVASRFNYEEARQALHSIANQTEQDPKIIRTLKSLHELLKEIEVQAKHLGKSTITGYSAPVAVSTAAIHARRLRDRELPTLLKRHDYEAARQAVRRVHSYADPDPETGRWLRRLEDLLVTLDAWDRFDHRRAVQVLTQLDDRRLDQPLLFPLKRVIGSRRLLDTQAAEQKWPQMKGHGLEAVEDLLRNAERRVTQERFDDAVGRLYRAMELTAQLLLKIAVTEKVGPAGIDTGCVDLDRLPSDIRPRWQQLAERKSSSNKGTKLEIGLTDAYELLADLGHPTGLRWRDQRNELVNSLQIRNHSLFAHGFASVDRKQWGELSSKLGGFLQAAIEQHSGGPGVGVRLAQLPTSLAELELEP